MEEGEADCDRSKKVGEERDVWQGRPLCPPFLQGADCTVKNSQEQPQSWVELWTDIGRGRGIWRRNYHWGFWQGHSVKGRLHGEGLDLSWRPAKVETWPMDPAAGLQEWGGVCVKWGFSRRNDPGPKEAIPSIGAKFSAEKSVFKGKQQQSISREAACQKGVLWSWFDGKSQHHLGQSSRFEKEIRSICSNFLWKRDIQNQNYEENSGAWMEPQRWDEYDIKGTGRGEDWSVQQEDSWKRWTPWLCSFIHQRPASASALNQLMVQTGGSQVGTSFHCWRIHSCWGSKEGQRQSYNSWSWQWSCKCFDATAADDWWGGDSWQISICA